MRNADLSHPPQTKGRIRPFEGKSQQKVPGPFRAFGGPQQTKCPEARVCTMTHIHIRGCLFFLLLLRVLVFCGVRGKPKEKKNADPHISQPQFVHSGVSLGFSEESDHFWRGTPRQQ